MAQSSKGNPTAVGTDVFDVRKVRRLVELMQENDLTELDIQQGDMRIQLKRGVSVSAIGTGMLSALPQTLPLPIASVPAAMSPVIPAMPSVEETNVHVIKSPMVGTFYTAPNPDAAPFVKIGDNVNTEKTVCLIEAMKVYNEIQAECSGKIVALLAKNGEMVEFGTPLFKVSIE